MKKLLTLFSAVIMATGIAATAHAITLKFDDILTPGGLAGNSGFTYNGYVFSTNTDVIDLSNPDVSDGGPVAVSPNNALMNLNYGTIAITKENGGAFNFADTWLRIYGGPFENIAGSVTGITGTTPGTPQAITGISSSTGWTDITANLTGVNEVDITIFDFDSSQINFLLDNITLTDVTGTGGGSPVPEPSTMVLLGAGLVGFAAWRKRKQSAR